MCAHGSVLVSVLCDYGPISGLYMIPQRMTSSALCAYVHTYVCMHACMHACALHLLTLTYNNDKAAHRYKQSVSALETNVNTHTHTHTQTHTHQQLLYKQCQYLSSVHIHTRIHTRMNLTLSQKPADAHI